MKVPLLAMTLLGLALVGYGLFNLMKKNPEVRAEIMKLLPPEQQVQLTNLLNQSFDLGNRAGQMEAVDPAATCTGPSDQANCKPGQNGLPPNQLPHQVILPKEIPPPTTGTTVPPPKTGNFDPATGNAAGALTELKNIQEQKKAEQKALDDLMKE